MDVRIAFRISVTVAALWLGASASALADCKGAATLEGIALPPEKLALRKGAFEELCNKRGGDLVDGGDSALKARLTAPTKAIWPAPSTGRGAPDAKKKKGPTVLVYIVEKSGEVSWLSILQSSGSNSLDEMAARTRAKVRYEQSAQLDGMPVPIFVTEKVDLLRRDFISDKPL